jgi:CRISPR/Cas system-associated exonuclease Cas4 (RecB family)
MTLDDVLDKIEAIIDSTHSFPSPLEMKHCKYCTTWLTLTEMVA